MAKKRKTAARNSKGRFVKGGGSKALVRTRTRTVTRYRTRSAPLARRTSRRRRSSMGGGGVTPAKLAIAGLGLGYLFGPNQDPAPIKQLHELADKIPGTKTFGRPAVVGLTLGAVERFTKLGGRFRPWMRAAGAIGIALAAVNVGNQGSKFKWLGEPDDDLDDDALMDVEDAD